MAPTEFTRKPLRLKRYCGPKASAQRRDGSDFGHVRIGYLGAMGAWLEFGGFVLLGAVVALALIIVHAWMTPEISIVFR